MKMFKKTLLVVVIAVCFVVPNVFAAGEPEGEPLKIGVLGVMSGHAASWGLVCKYSAEANAKIINEQGGVVIDGVRHKIEIVSVDTKQDPKIAVTGAERLVYQEGIKYIVGPNIDNTAVSVAPVMEAAGAVYIPYNQSREVFSPPHRNAILGMIASFQSGPIIYKYMKENLGVKSIAFVARNQPDPLSQRRVGVEAAKKTWLDNYLLGRYL
jgi:branched-chain amino acid transport system substrate-binding protein